nr:MAG TPA: hypothetical protein [Caudoviricetes sp.]
MLKSKSTTTSRKSGGIYASNRQVQPWKPYRTKPMFEGKYE